MTIKESVVVHLLLAIIFFISGLTINIFQVFLYFCIRPFSRNIYRKINYYLCYFLYSQLVCLAEYWGDTHILLYVDKDDFKKYYGKEHAYVTMNHRYEIDWLIGWILCERLGLLGNCKAYVKKPIQYVPVIGWTWKFAEYVFLVRNWEEDKDTINSQIRELASYEESIWLLLYPEGTRFTQEKFEASQKYALKKGITPLKYHLMPRTRGFTASLKCMRGKVPAIYNVQLHFKPSDPVTPSMGNLLLGKRVEAHLYMKRIPLEDVPEDEERAAEWLNELYRQKDRLADSFYKTGDFFATSGVPRLEAITPKRRCYSCLNIIIWGVIVLIPVTYYVISLILSKSIFSILIVMCLLSLIYWGMNQVMGLSEISKSSSYGISKNVGAEK